VRKRKWNRKVYVERKTVRETTQHWVRTICCRLYSTLNTSKCCSSEIRDDLSIILFSIVCTKNKTNYPVVTADSNVCLNQVYDVIDWKDRNLAYS
jgi:hypothetical protein